MLKTETSQEKPYMTLKAEALRINGATVYSNYAAIRIDTTKGGERFVMHYDAYDEKSDNIKLENN